MFINELHQRSEELLKKGDIEGALSLLNRLITDFPDNPDLYSDRGVAFLHLKDVNACFNDLNKAIELQSDYAFRYACRAFAKNHFGDLNGAIEDYKIAIELDPKDAVAHNNLGLLLEQKGYKDEAQERFDRADKLSKMEDHLYELMDEMEVKEDEGSQLKEISTEKKKDSKSTLSEMKKVLTSRSEFKAFISFVKNGFKIK